MADRSVNLLEGSISKALGKLALPIMGSSLIQMAYNLTDMFWVGRLGASAVAAAGTGGLFMWFSESLMLLPRMGGQVLCGQALGAGRPREASRWIRGALQLGFILGLLYALTLFFLRGPLVAYFGFHEKATITMSLEYIAGVSPGIIFTYIARIMVGLLTAAGNSRTPFINTAVGLGCNMVLDPLFIFGFDWGVTGAALATTLSQFVVFLLFILSARPMPLFRQLGLLRPLPGHYYRKIAKIGYPAGLQNMVYSGVTIIISRFIASFGDAAVAGHRIGSQVECLSWLSSDGLATGVNAMVAQNFGAGKLDRARKGYRVAILYSAIIGGLATLLLLIFPRELVNLFVNDPTTIRLGGDYLWVIAFSEIAMCLELMTAGAFAGYGKTLFPAVLCTVLTLARIPLALVLMQTSLGLNGIWWAITISSLAKGSTMLVTFLIRERRLAAGGLEGKTLKEG